MIKVTSPINYCGLPHGYYNVGYSCALVTEILAMSYSLVKNVKTCGLVKVLFTAVVPMDGLRSRQRVGGTKSFSQGLP